MATILICDNEESLRELVRASLETEGYAFLEARDGDEAIAAVEAHRPDLVLLDMMMPGRSGLDVLRTLRSQEELADIPVVMLTARAQLTDRDDANAAGATFFVTKPFSPVQLANVVADVLAGRA